MSDEPHRRPLDGEPRCRACSRPISYRQKDAQNGECNDCYAGPPVALAECLRRLPADAREALMSKRKAPVE